MYVVIVKPGARPAGWCTPGFLKLTQCGGLCICVRVYVSAPEITSGVIWTPYDRLNKFYSCYTATLVGIVDKRGLGIDMHYEN